MKSEVIFKVTMKPKEELDYFKKRDGTLFKAATKEEIYNVLDIYDFEMIKKFLQYMDYPWFPEQWIRLIMTCGETPKILGKYVSYCRLKGILPLGYIDSKFIPRSIEKNMFEKARQRMDPDYYGN